MASHSRAGPRSCWPRFPRWLPWWPSCGRPGRRRPGQQLAVPRRAWRAPQPGSRPDRCHARAASPCRGSGTSDAAACHRSLDSRSARPRDKDRNPSESRRRVVAGLSVRNCESESLPISTIWGISQRSGPVAPKVAPGLQYLGSDRVGHKKGRKPCFQEVFRPSLDLLGLLNGGDGGNRTPVRRCSMPGTTCLARCSISDGGNTTCEAHRHPHPL